jgi:multiple antibiotic resistance protein
LFPPSFFFLLFLFFLWLAALIGAILAVIALCWIVCRLATGVQRLIGASASIVMEKLIGVLLASLAVQFVMDGARSLFS